MNRLIATLSIAALFGLAAGCGEDTDTLTVQEANQALQVTMTALNGVDTATGMATVDGDRVVAVAPCPAGGEAAISGRLIGQTMISMDVEFQGCSADGTTIDGSLDYDGTFTETRITLDMNGILDFSGMVNGRCRIDFSMEIDDELGVSMQGSVCGQNIEILQGQGQ